MLAGHLIIQKKNDKTVNSVLIGYNVTKKSTKAKIVEACHDDE